MAKSIFCFDGLPNNSILFIRTIASRLKKLDNRMVFYEGLLKLINRCHPNTLVIYGSSRYPIFNEVTNLGVHIISFQSDTSIAFERRKNL